MKILIFGASGAAGQELVKQALEQGLWVSAFVCNPSKLRIKHEQLKIFQGNVIDPIAVEDAVKDQDAVLSTPGVS